MNSSSRQGGDDAHCERLTQGSKRRVWHTLYKEPLVRSLPFISTKKPPNASKNGRSGWSRRAKFSIFRNKKKAALGGFLLPCECRGHFTKLVSWCGRRDSNSHTFRRWNLNPVCLPIPPRPRFKPLKQRRRIFKSGAFRIWGGRRGSNPRQRESQSRALPTELRPPYSV